MYQHCSAGLSAWIIMGSDMGKELYSIERGIEHWVGADAGWSW